MTYVTISTDVEIDMRNIDTDVLEEELEIRRKKPGRNKPPKAVSLESVDVRAIGAMVTARQDEGVKNATIKRDLTAVSRVLAFAANQGMTTTGNPAKAYDRAFLGEDRAVLAPPSDAAITKAAKWMDEVHPQWGALLRWLRATGMRLGETMAARRTDLVEAIEHGRHVTRLAITRPKGARRGRMRLISLSPEALALLPLLGADQLFDHWDVSVPGNVSSQWGAHRRQEGVPHFRLHDLRHAHAVAELRKDPTALYRISRHLGHSSVATTERHYLRFLSDEAQHLAKYGTPSQTPSQGEKRDRAKKLQIVK